MTSNGMGLDADALWLLGLAVSSFHTINLTDPATFPAKRVPTRATVPRTLIHAISKADVSIIMEPKNIIFADFYSMNT